MEQKKKRLLFVGLLVVTALDLLFFAGKYTPFSKQEYFYPETKVLKFLKNQPGQFRTMVRSRMILSPNIMTMYKLQSIDGYDPLYLMRYGELIASSERGIPDISAPFGFNRIVVPTNYNTSIINLLGVKYILSLTDLESSYLHKVFQEGETRVYENNSAYPRAFFVESVIKVGTKQQAINELYNPKTDLLKDAIVEDGDDLKDIVFGKGIVEIKSYKENTVLLKTSINKPGFLVLTDTYYPTWRVTVDGKEEKIYRTDYNFRGILVPAGIHTVEFRNTLL